MIRKIFTLVIVKREIRLKIIICVRESPSIGDDRTDNLKGEKGEKEGLDYWRKEQDT